MPDFNNWKKWVNYILKNLPKFNKVYSATEDTLNYFKKNFDVELLKININISSTIIREMIKKDYNDWKNWTWIDEKTKKIIEFT